MKNRAAEIHDGLKHPVIDGDGHWLEPIPVFLEYLQRSGRRAIRRSNEGDVARERRVVSGDTTRNVNTIDCAAPSGGA